MGQNQREAPTQEEIARCAYLLFERGGRQPGCELQHWYEAEAQLWAMRAHEVALREQAPLNAGPGRPAREELPRGGEVVSAGARR